MRERIVLGWSCSICWWIVLHTHRKGQPTTDFQDGDGLLCAYTQSRRDSMQRTLMILLDDEKHVSTSFHNCKFAFEWRCIEIVIISTTNENPASTTTLSADKINEMCGVVWQNCDKKYDCYLGYVTKSENNMFVVDHLDRCLKN